MYRKLNLGAFIRRVTLNGKNIRASGYYDSAVTDTAKLDIYKNDLNSVVATNSTVRLSSNDFNIDVVHNYLTAAQSPTGNLVLMGDDFLNDVNFLSTLKTRLPRCTFHGTKEITVETTTVKTEAYGILGNHTARYVYDGKLDFKRYADSHDIPADSTIVMMFSFSDAVNRNDIVSDFIYLYENIKKDYNVVVLTNVFCDIIPIDSIVNHFNEFIRNSFPVTCYEVGAVVISDSEHWNFTAGTEPDAKSGVYLIKPTAAAHTKMAEAAAGAITLFYRGVKGYEFI